jgi:hypothetical protein
MKAMAWSALVLAIGCGGSAAPPKTVDVSDQSGEGVGPEERADLTPVPAPAELFVVGRLSNPARVLDTVGSWTKLPFDWRQLLAKEEPGVDRVVYLDAPLEFAVALGTQGSGQFPKPLAVVSVGLTSLQSALDFARGKGQAVRHVRAGVYRVGGAGDESCAIAASVGKAPARLVCGERSEDVDQLLPYVTRGLPNEQLGAADLHIELRLEPIRRKYASELRQLRAYAPFAVRELSIDNARFDRALKDAAHALAEELTFLAEDLDTISLDGTLSGDRIDTVWRARFRGTQSWSAQMLADAGTRAAGPSPTFWKLPADSDSASYNVGVDPKRYERIGRTLAELLDGWLEHEQFPRRIRDDLADLTEELFKIQAASVYASGALAWEGDPASELEVARQTARASLGWHIAAIEEKPDRYKKSLAKLARSYNDAALRKELQKRLGVEPKDLPKLTTRAGRGLPAGSVVYELAVPLSMFDLYNVGDPPPPAGAKAPPAKPIPFVLILVPQGDTTWLGVSADEKVLTQKLSLAMKGPADKSLASRGGLTELSSMRAVTGGFLSLASFMSGARAWPLMVKGEDPNRVISAMPNKGQTPLLMSVTARPEGKGLLVDMNLQLPRAFVEDIAAAVPAIAAGSLYGPVKGPAWQHPPAPAP